MAAELQDTFQSDFCAERLRALGDPHRLRVIEALRSGEQTVTDLALLLDVEVVNLSHHLQVLRRAELVRVRREGRFMYYSVHPGLAGRRFLDLGCCRLEVPQPPGGR